jgi:hypothetical protein
MLHFTAVKFCEELKGVLASDSTLNVPQEREHLVNCKTKLSITVGYVLHTEIHGV